MLSQLAAYTRRVEKGGRTRRAGAAQAMELVEPLVGLRPFLIVSDFDGTLSRSALDPWAASIIPSAQRALRRLTRIEGVHVALLSGRLALDLAARARIGRATYVGNSGMERGSLAARGRVRSMHVEVIEVADAHVALADRLAAEVQRSVAEAWLVVEHKPASVAFHFRAAPDLVAAARRIRAAVDAIDTVNELSRVAGRRALELRPRDAPTKGDAFRALLAERQPQAALMLGDDVNDVAAFEALWEARERGSLSGLAIAVKARDELPAAVALSSDVVLESPGAAARFLSALARRLGCRAAP